MLRSLALIKSEASKEDVSRRSRGRRDNRREKDVLCAQRILESCQLMLAEDRVLDRRGNDSGRVRQTLRWSWRGSKRREEDRELVLDLQDSRVGHQQLLVKRSREKDND